MITSSVTTDPSAGEVTLADLAALIRNLRARRGARGAQRAERVADEAPEVGRQYSLDALEGALATGDPFTFLHPSRFEEFAAPLTTAQESDRWYGPRLASVVKALDEVQQDRLDPRKGLNDIPQLWVYPGGGRGYHGDPRPSIVAHDGRHRSRVLANRRPNERTVVELHPANPFSSDQLPNLDKVFGVQRERGTHGPYAEKLDAIIEMMRGIDYLWPEGNPRLTVIPRDPKWGRPVERWVPTYQRTPVKFRGSIEPFQHGGKVRRLLHGHHRDRPGPVRKARTAFDVFTHKGRPGFTAVVDLRDGAVVHVTDYETAKRANFHHSFYTPEHLLEGMRDGHLATVWYDKEGLQSWEQIDPRTKGRILEGLGLPEDDVLRRMLQEQDEIHRTKGAYGQGADEPEEYASGGDVRKVSRRLFGTKTKEPIPPTQLEPEPLPQLPAVLPEERIIASDAALPGYERLPDEQLDFLDEAAEALGPRPNVLDLARIQGGAEVPDLVSDLVNQPIGRRTAIRGAAALATNASRLAKLVPEAAKIPEPPPYSVDWEKLRSEGDELIARLDDEWPGDAQGSVPPIRGLFSDDLADLDYDPDEMEAVRGNIIRGIGQRVWGRDPTIGEFNAVEEYLRRRVEANSTLEMLRDDSVKWLYRDYEGSFEYAAHKVARNLVKSDPDHAREVLRRLDKIAEDELHYSEIDDDEILNLLDEVNQRVSLTGLEHTGQTDDEALEALASKAGIKGKDYRAWLRGHAADDEGDYISEAVDYGNVDFLNGLRKMLHHEIGGIPTDGPDGPGYYHELPSIQWHRYDRPDNWPKTSIQVKVEEFFKKLPSEATPEIVADRKRIAREIHRLEQELGAEGLDTGRERDAANYLSEDDRIAYYQYNRKYGPGGRE